MSTKARSCSDVGSVMGRCGELADRNRKRNMLIINRPVARRADGRAQFSERALPFVHEVCARRRRVYPLPRICIRVQ
jgi:hypothetical protein